MLGMRSDGVSGYASVAGFEVVFTGEEPCKTEKNLDRGAGLQSVVGKLIRGSLVIALAGRDVDIKLGNTGSYMYISNRFDTRNTLLLVVGASVTFEIFAALLGPSSLWPLLRSALLVVLCFVMLSGSNRARLALSGLYLLLGVGAARLLLSGWSHLSIQVAFAQATFSAFMFLASAFIFFSPTLRALTAKQNEKSGASNA
jgi:hypothetical protein